MNMDEVALLSSFQALLWQNFTLSQKWAQNGDQLDNMSHLCLQQLTPPNGFTFSGANVEIHHSLWASLWLITSSFNFVMH